MSVSGYFLTKVKLSRYLFRNVVDDINQEKNGRKPVKQYKENSIQFCNIQFALPGSSSLIICKLSFRL